jgi:hypothetical protein
VNGQLITLNLLYTARRRYLVNTNSSGQGYRSQTEGDRGGVQEQEGRGRQDAPPARYPGEPSIAPKPQEAQCLTILYETTPFLELDITYTYTYIEVKRTDRRHGRTP